MNSAKEILFVAVVLALGSSVPILAGEPAPAPDPSVEFLCFSEPVETLVTVRDGAEVLLQLRVPACVPLADDMGKPAQRVPAALLARLRDGLAGSPRPAAAMVVAALRRALGQRADTPEADVPPTLAVPFTGSTTITWCGTEVSADRKDCLGSCTCGGPGGCACTGTKTVIDPHHDLSPQLDGRG